MAVIKPFKGIRYNPVHVENPGTVITPPYDVIDSVEQENLHRKNPYNIIRLEYGKSSPQDSLEDNRYTRAAATLNLWLEKEILVTDKEKCYYLYEQSFTFNGNEYKRRGVIAALKLQPYADQVVLPHELTMAGPKADRMELLKSLKTNVSPIFTLFPDPEKRLDILFSSIDYANPDLVARKDSGQTHRLWIINDLEAQNNFTAYLAPQPLLIADGHHRYETALNYALNNDLKKTPGAAYILTIMVSMKDEGLLVLPTHRLLSGLAESQKENLKRLIEEKFVVTTLGDPRSLDKNNFLEQLTRESNTNKGFGFITAGKACLLRPKKQADETTLPVALLHEELLTPLLAREVQSSIDKKTISYPHDLNGALEAVLSKTADAAFILDPIAVEKVLTYAGQGKFMPQKSTFFYPKLPSGLVLYSMERS